MKERFIEVSEMNVFQLNWFKYEVKGKGNDAVVDLGQMTYSFRVFDIDRLSYIHAIATCEQAEMQVYNLFSNYYKLSTWALAYVETIYPVPSQVDWNILDNEVVIKVKSPDVLNKLDKA